MTKDELIRRLCNLLDEVDIDMRQDFDDVEIEDLIVEAGLPTSRTLPNLKGF